MYFDSEWRLIKLFGQTWIMHLPSLLFSIPLFLIALSFNKQWKYHYIVQFLSESSISIFMFHYADYNRIKWERIIKPYFHNLDTHWKAAISLTFKLYVASALVEFVRLHIFNTLIYKRKYFHDFANFFNYFFMGMK